MCNLCEMCKCDRINLLFHLKQIFSNYTVNFFLMLSAISHPPFHERARWTKNWTPQEYKIVTISHSLCESWHNNTLYILSWYISINSQKFQTQPNHIFKIFKNSKIIILVFLNFLGKKKKKLKNRSIIEYHKIFGFFIN